MSAGPSPPNPGTQRRGPSVPKASLLARRGPLIATGVALLGTAYVYMSAKPPAPSGTVTANPMRTPGVSNVEAAYTNAGATSTHTKAYGGTTQGQKTDENVREGGGSAIPKGTKQNEHLGDEQRPNAPNAIGREFKDMQYGDKRGK